MASTGAAAGEAEEPPRTPTAVSPAVTIGASTVGKEEHRVDGGGDNSAEKVKSAEKGETKIQKHSAATLEALEALYEADKFPSEAARKETGDAIGLSERQVGVSVCEREFASL
jgi:hypothetical protein